MRIASIIFDLDGTMVDTSEDIAASVNAARAAFGRVPIAVGEAMLHIGDGLDQLLRRTVCEREEHIPRARIIYLEHQARHSCDHARLYPGVADGLGHLAGAGVRLSVVSNKAQLLAVPMLEYLGIAGYFSSVLGEELQPRKKPAPDGLLLVLHEQGVQPDEALMVGDSWQDIRAGAEAGCRTVWCRYGFGKLDGQTPDFSVQSFADVLQVAGCDASAAP